MTSLGDPLVRRRWAATALVLLLSVAMVTSTLLQGALSVLSRFILDEFGITRSQFGLVFSAYSVVGGLTSIYIGGWADRDSRLVMMGLFVFAAVSVVGTALAPTYLVLVAAVLLGGLALGAGNPVTNRLIAERVPIRRRGLVIGIKQAGPPMGIFLAGIVLPTVAVAFGWRVAVSTAVLIPVAGLVGTFLLMSPGDNVKSTPTRVSDLDDRARFVVRWLMGIGFAIALTNSAAIAFLPLFAQEDLLLSTTVAGVIAAFVGLAGVVGRVIWGGVTPRFKRPSSSLLVIAATSAVSFAAIGLSSSLGVAWLWVGAIGSGATVLAWHAVAYLVIIDRVEMAAIGRASGIMHMGSTLGFATGAPLAGLLLDATESYVLMWGLLAAMMVGITLFTAQFRMRAARRFQGR